MNRLLIFTFIFITSCSVSDNQLKDFNYKLGAQKAKDLSQLTNEFNAYLAKLYPSQKDFNDRFNQLLTGFSDSSYGLKPYMKISDTIAEAIIRLYNENQLRKELWLTEIEMDSVMKQKGIKANIIMQERGKDVVLDTISLLHPNIYSDYHLALSKIKTNDFIKTYIAAREREGDLSFYGMSEAFLTWSDSIDYNDPILQRIVTLDIFIPLAYLSTNP